MDLNVLGIPQLYAYLIGWWQYDVWWAVLRSTGIFYIVITVMFLKCIVVPFASQEARAASSTMVKRILISWVGLFLAISLFALPIISINVHSILFANATTGQTVNPFNNKSTYANNIPDSVTQVGIIEMPVGFYMAVSMFNGIGTVMYDSLADDTTIREAQQIASTVGIKNGETRLQYVQFIHDCYEPAYADVMNGNYDSTSSIGIDVENNYTKNNGVSLNNASDPVLEKDFYPKYKAQEPVKGFPFIASEDSINAQGGKSFYPKYAMPQCNVWWPKLNNQLYDDINKQWLANNPNNENQSILDYVNSQHWWSEGTQEEYKSAIVQTFLQKSFGSNQSLAQNYYTEADYDKNIGSDFQKGVGLSYQSKLGGLQGSFSTLIEMLPLIQAYILVAVFALLPIGLMWSGFSFKFILGSLSLIFSVIACTYLWHLVSFIDNFFIQSMTISSHLNNTSMYSQLNKILIGSSSSGYSSSVLQIIINMVTAIMYIVFPSILTGFFTMAGIATGGALDSALGKASSSSQEAQKGFTSAVGMLQKIAAKMKIL